MREVLRILQQHELRASDLEEKVLDLAAQLLVLCGKDENYEKAYTLAKKTLQNGEARKKMQEIISAQEGNPDVDSEGLVLGIQTFDIVSECDGKVEAIDMKYLNMLARTLGAPWDATAWIFLHKKLYDTVHRWEILFSFYASSENKLQMAKELVEEKSAYTITLNP